MNSQKNETNSMIMMILSMLIFGTIGIFRRYIPLSSAILACYRGLSGSLFLLLIMILTRKKLTFPYGIKKLFLLILTGIAIGLNWILLFEAYNYTTVATATLCYYMQPTIVILLSPVVFREKLTTKKGICALISIIGMILVSGMAENGLPAASDARGILCGLGAAVLYATVVILNKKLPGIDAYVKTIIQLFSAAVVLIPYLALTTDLTSISLNSTAILMLIVVGLVHTGIAYALYFGSMEGLRSTSIALISYIDPVTALILSALLLREPLTIFGMIGAVMILVAALISEL